MLRHIRGYTLIEVLIVITVLGILSAIAVVSWSGVVTSSNNQARLNDAKQWQSTFDLYRSRYLSYPIMPTDASTPAVACLGAVNSFPTSAGAISGGNTCGNYMSPSSGNSASTNGAIATAVAKVGKVPRNSHEDSGQTIVDKTFVGPIAYISQNANSGNVTVTARFLFYYKGSSCPTSPSVTTTQYTSAAFSSLSALNPTNGTIVCYIESTLNLSL